MLPDVIKLAGFCGGAAVFRVRAAE